MYLKYLALIGNLYIKGPNFKNKQAKVGRPNFCLQTVNV